MAKIQALTSWEKALADAATKAAGKEAASASVGQFFSIRGGQLSWGGTPIPGSQMGCVILASTIERVYYEGAFDPKNPSSPTCYAFGDDLNEMQPFEQVENKQGDACSTCPQNEWGTSNSGIGKACRELRRISLISGGSYDPAGRFQMFDADEFKAAAAGMLRVPTTSIKNYSGWVMQVTSALRRPPWGVICRVKVEPDPNSQVRVLFETQAELPTELLEAVHSRVAAAEKTLVFAYPKGPDKPAAPKAGRGRNTKFT